MRNLLSIAIVAIQAASLSSLADAQDRIPWAVNLDVARQAASQQNRLVLIHFFADDCPPCHRLERSVFSTPEFIRSLSMNYVPVKVNAREIPDLAQHYGVDRWPTDVIIRPDGTPVYRSVSPQESNQYIAMLDQVAAHDRLQMQAPVANSYTPPPPSFGAPQGNSAPAGVQAGFSSDRNSAYSDTPTGPSPQQSQSFYRDSLAQAPSDQSAPAQPTYGYPNETSNSPSRYGQAPLDSTQAASFSQTTAPPYAAEQSAAAAPPQQPTPSFQMPPKDLAANVQNSGRAPDPQANRNEVASYSPAPPTTSTNGGDPGMQWNPHINQPAQNQTAQQPITPPTMNPVPAQEHPPLALDGQCPVTLVRSSQWKKGDPRWGAIHRNRLYLFAGPDEQRQFLASPDQYSPVLSGYDPVKFMKTGQLVEGKREHGVMFNQIYLFADEASLDEFWGNPNYFSTEAQRIMREADARTGQQPTRR